MVPIRRSDVLSDEEFLNLGELSQFLLQHGAFHFSTTPAILPDGSYLGLYTWRDQHQSDISDIEVQRLALFMRHLMVMVDVTALIPIEPAGPHYQREAMHGFAEQHGLTETENRILVALLSGHAPRSIASQTDRSYGIVRWHIQNILEKCGVNSQKELFRAFFQAAD
jgi:DNA-binding CsgD family transcriptional regulator